MSIKRKLGIFGKLAVSLLAGCLMVSCVTDETSFMPTRWFGPSGNGIYPDTGLLKEWPVEGPEVIWTYDSLGIGFSSAVIQNDFLFTTGMTDSTGYLSKLNLEGGLIYKVPYGLEWTGSYPGTRGSPTVVGEKIYLISGRGKVICFHNSDGSIVWSKEMFTDFDGKNIMWGINETPVVDGDLIYATPGGEIHNVIALDRHTGELVWSCKGEGKVSAYCTPLFVDHNGKKLLVTYSASHLLGIDRVSGELLWSLDLPSEWSVHANTPLYHKGEILYPSGLDLGGGKLKLSEDGNSVSILWENKAIDYRSTALLLNGYIYESFSDLARLTWRCVDWETGKESFVSKELGHGRAIYADGMLYLYTSRGELALVKPDPEEFKVVSQTKITHGSGLHLAQHMMNDGVLYVRHGNAMIAYEVKS
ncbi:MAG: PQQ-binding-like beta-propeller repeat protein [Bacteroidota bacterium]